METQNTLRTCNGKKAFFKKNKLKFAAALDLNKFPNQITVDYLRWDELRL